MAYTVTL